MLLTYFVKIKSQKHTVHLLFFIIREDAIKAKETVTHCDGRKIFLDFADAKKNRKGKQNKASQSGSLTAQEKTQEGWRYDYELILYFNVLVVHKFAQSARFQSCGSSKQMPTFLWKVERHS